ncbi:uncharacterized protein [Nicotiana sylvestris]|uniref:uncharacterized protein n=1 Tax=Nicotiana sylvestris TaxID=4096 RepID=UPI00388CD814
MPVLSTDLVVHKLPIDPAFPPVKQKLRKFKIDMSVKIKEEITKQFDAKVIRVKRYPTWLANVVPVPKKDGKTRVCVDYHDLNKSSPKDNFPLPNIHILIDSCAKHEIGYNLKLNPAKCAFGVPSGKLLGFIVSRWGIELDPSKIKATQELPPPKNKTKVMSLLGRLNYISRFIAQLTTTCEPIFNLLKKDVAVNWTDEFQEAFDKIKEYLSNPLVLVLPEPRRPLILYLTVLDNSFGYVLGMHSGTKASCRYRNPGSLGLGRLRPSGALDSRIMGDAGLKAYTVSTMHIPRIYNEVVDALATLESMLHHPDRAYVDPLHIQVCDQHAYCNMVEEELDGEPWFHDIRDGGVLYKRTPDLGLLRCIDARQASTIMTESKITHCNSTPYHPKANGAVEPANKNIKKIVRKMMQGSRQWHKKLPFALLGYHTTVRTSVGATPYLFVYGPEAVIPVEVEITSLQIIAEAKIDDDEWVKTYVEKLRFRPNTDLQDSFMFVIQVCTERSLRKGILGNARFNHIENLHHSVLPVIIISAFVC